MITGKTKTIYGSYGSKMEIEGQCTGHGVLKERQGHSFYGVWLTPLKLRKLAEACIQIAKELEADND